MTTSTLPQPHEHRKIEKLLLKLSKVKPHPDTPQIAAQPQGRQEPLGGVDAANYKHPDSSSFERF